MVPKNSIEAHICNAYQLICQYEDILRESSDPKERARAHRVIEQQQQLIRYAMVRYRRLCNGLAVDMADEVQQIAIILELPDEDEPVSITLSEQPNLPVMYAAPQSTPSPLRSLTSVLMLALIVLGVLYHVFEWNTLPVALPELPIESPASSRTVEDIPTTPTFTEPEPGAPPTPEWTDMHQVAPNPPGQILGSSNPAVTQPVGENLHVPDTDSSSPPPEPPGESEDQSTPAKPSAPSEPPSKDYPAPIEPGTELLDDDSSTPREEEAPPAPETELAPTTGVPEQSSPISPQVKPSPTAASRVLVPQAAAAEDAPAAASRNSGNYIVVPLADTATPSATSVAHLTESATATPTTTPPPTETPTPPPTNTPTKTQTTRPTETPTPPPTNTPTKTQTTRPTETPTPTTMPTMTPSPRPAYPDPPSSQPTTAPVSPYPHPQRLPYPRP